MKQKLPLTAFVPTLPVADASLTAAAQCNRRCRLTLLNMNAPEPGHTIGCSSSPEKTMNHRFSKIVQFLVAAGLSIHAAEAQSPDREGRARRDARADAGTPRNGGDTRPAASRQHPQKVTPTRFGDPLAGLRPISANLTAS